MEIRNLKEAARRIKEAIKNKERIVLYGDSDLDGASSVVILKEIIKNLGGEVSAVYFPDRENDGYGISEKALEKLEKYRPALMIVSDCGISNFKEVKKAKEMGFNMIIIEHHEVLNELPAADIIINPKQKEDKYPFKNLATTGIVFKLAEILLAGQMTDALRRNFLELAALATLADMMPLEKDNELIVQEGLLYLEKSWRPGIRVLLEMEEIKGLSLKEKVQKIISLLNVRDLDKEFPVCFYFLTTTDKKEAEELAKKLIIKNKERKKILNSITDQIRIRYSYSKSEAIIFEGDKDWDLSLLGIVASILLTEYQKPIFLFKKNDQESQGSARAPRGINLVDAMKSCADYLETYGGHPPAGGFRIKNENLSKFKQCLIDYFVSQ